MIAFGMLIAMLSKNKEK
ncbi:hypothetical protein MST20_10705 [Bacillus sp. B19-2]|nr:hypothetical protein [Bacillus paralicheniformis]MCJ2146898.1 hypothetical protein [Bacillus sp. B19-2]UZN56984.1 hypothetical protein OPU65_18530 [Bacillus paralicheniformis]